MVSYKLDEIVRQYLIETGEPEAKYFRFLQIAISGLRELNLDVSGIPSTVLLPINSNDTVDLPLDYLNYVRIALAGTDGNLQALGANGNMTFLRAYSNCGVPEKPAETATSGGIIGWELFSDHYRNGEEMGRFFGLGGGNNVNGYYRIDRENGYIQLGQLNYAPASIVLEYLADIKEINEEFHVHPYVVETLKSWIYWKSIQRNRTIGLGEKQLAAQEYRSQYLLSARRFNSATFDEWNAVFRLSNKLAPRY